MVASPRLDELRRKFEENPRRYFAPLANELRRAGDPHGAIALCRDQLARHPDHMSGHVVLGQALHDAGEADEADATFRRAVALDPENLIALRHLGDLARDRGEPAEARRWYGRVLDVDPRNEEIAGLVAALDAAPPVTADPPIAESDFFAPRPPAADMPLELPATAEWVEGAAAFEPLDLAPFEPVELAGLSEGASAEAATAADATWGAHGDGSAAGPEVPPATEPTGGRVEPPADPVSELAPIDLAFDELLTLDEGDARQADAPAGAAAHVELVDAFDAFDDASDASDEPSPVELPPSALVDDLGLRDLDAFDVAAGEHGVTAIGDLAAPSSALRADDAPIGPARASDPLDLLLPPLPDDVPAFDPVVGLDLPPRPPAASEARVLPPALGLPDEEMDAPELAGTVFATETMATLLEQQGHFAQAADVLRQLVARRPEDAALTERLARVEARVRAAADEPADDPAMRAPSTPTVSSVAPLADDARPASPARVAPPSPNDEDRQTAAPAPASDDWFDDGAAAAADESASAGALDALFAAPASAREERLASALAAGFDAPAVAEGALALVAELFDAPDAQVDAPAAADASSAPDETPYGLADLSFDRFFVGLEQQEATAEAADATPTVAPLEECAADAAPSPASAPVASNLAAPASASPFAPTSEQVSTPDDARDLAEFNAWLRSLAR